MIDPYPISALVDRYKLNSKQAIYDRIKALNIVPVSRGKISSSQLEELDELDNHLNNGGSFASFKQASNSDAAPRSIVNSPVDEANFPLDELLERSTDDGRKSIAPLSLQQLSEGLNYLVSLIGRDPLKHYEHLERAYDRGWLLTTSECAAILGAKPRGSAFTRGSFVLVKAGKIGNQTAWRITKPSQDNQ